MYAVEELFQKGQCWRLAVGGLEQLGSKRIHTSHAGPPFQFFEHN